MAIIDDVEEHVGGVSAVREIADFIDDEDIGMRVRRQRVGEAPRRKGRREIVDELRRITTEIYIISPSLRGASLRKFSIERNSAIRPLNALPRVASVGRRIGYIRRAIRGARHSVAAGDQQCARNPSHWPHPSSRRNGAGATSRTHAVNCFSAQRVRAGG